MDDIQNLFEKIDDDGNGYLEWEEFAKGIQMLHSPLRDEAERVKMHLFKKERNAYRNPFIRY